jgi:hypothetical protein
MAASKRLKSRIRRKRRTARNGARSSPARTGWFKIPKSRARREQREELIEWVSGLKKRPCSDCKRVYPPYVMDFDHCTGRKRFTISQFVREHGGDPNAKVLLEVEIAKTQVVCSNCHRERTHRRASRRGFFR